MSHDPSKLYKYVDLLLKKHFSLLLMLITVGLLNIFEETVMYFSGFLFYYLFLDFCESVNFWIFLLKHFNTFKMPHIDFCEAFCFNEAKKSSNRFFISSIQTNNSNWHAEINRTKSDAIFTT